MNLYLKELYLHNFRNYKNVKLRFKQGLNCFVGPNGAGKTNLLDSIYVLCLSKSHLTNFDKENINHEEPVATLRGEFIKDTFSNTIQCCIERDKKKILKKNNKEYSKISDHIGLFPAILSAPNDVFWLINSKKHRQRLMDNIISQTNNKYLVALSKYNKTLASRNNILKTSPQVNVALLDIYNEQLVEYGLYIHSQRDAHVEAFSKNIAYFYEKIVGQSAALRLGYESQIEDEGQYLRELAARQRQDMSAGHTSFGVHKDEIFMHIGAKPINKFSSQGQQKSFMVALKLAQARFINEKSGIKPILLLDDIFDKLDGKRAQLLLENICAEPFGQVFITNTGREPITKYLSGEQHSHYYHIQNDEVAAEVATESRPTII